MLEKWGPAELYTVNDVISISSHDGHLTWPSLAKVALRSGRVRIIQPLRCMVIKFKQAASF